MTPRLMLYEMIALTSAFNSLGGKRLPEAALVCYC